MSPSPPLEPTQDSARLGRWATFLREHHLLVASLLAVALVAFEHLRITLVTPVPTIGGVGGPEYMEHLRRAVVLDALRGQSLLSPAAWRDAIDSVAIHKAMGIDWGEEYPPLLPLLQAPLDRLFGPLPQTAVGGNLLWVGLLAASTISAGASLGLSRHARILAGVLLVLLPATFGTARSWYYDLPMVAWLWVAFASMLAIRPGRTIGPTLLATLALTAAELTKWEAVLYLATTLPAVGWVVLRRSNQPLQFRVKAIAAIATSVGLASFAIARFVQTWSYSFEQRLNQFMGMNSLPGNSESFSNPSAGALFSLVRQRVFELDLDLWTYYPRWLLYSSLGTAGLAVALFALGRVRTWPTSLAGFVLLSFGCTWAVLTFGLDIHEVRFIHPALPALCLGMGAGLTPRNAQGSLRVSGLAAIVLLTGQMMCVNLPHNPPEKWHQNVAIPQGLQWILGESWPLLPLGTGNAGGWQHPTASQEVDTDALRLFLQAIDEDRLPWGLHPLNSDLGSEVRAWLYWSLHDNVHASPVIMPTESGCQDPDVVAALGEALDQVDLLVLDFPPSALSSSTPEFCRTTPCPSKFDEDDLQGCDIVEQLSALSADFSEVFSWTYTKLETSETEGRLYLLRRSVTPSSSLPTVPR